MGHRERRNEIMKLYATTTSERATKGQGGNNHIKIDLFVGSTKESRQVATVTLIALSSGGYELFYFNAEKPTENTTCLQTGELKAKKQTGENYKGSQREANDEAFDLANNS